MDKTVEQFLLGLFFAGTYLIYTYFNEIRFSDNISTINNGIK